MNVLIVEAEPELGRLWQNHLQRQGARVQLVATSDEAIGKIRAGSMDVIVVDLDLPSGGALTVADFASYRSPGARVVVVTSTSFFSDGSIFRHCPNACAFLQSDTPPEDLALLIAHYARPRVVAD